MEITRKLSLGLTDAFALLLVYLIPTLSHIAPFPIYLADPMRLVVLGSLLVTKNWKNTLVLALTLPLFSFMVSGHPVFLKSVLIAGELSVNVLLFTWLSRIGSVGVATFASIVISKVLYYVAKMLLIAGGALAMSLISTELYIQLAVAVVLSFIFSLLYTKK